MDVSRLYREKIGSNRAQLWLLTQKTIKNVSINTSSKKEG